MERRTYEFIGSSENLDEIEKFLRHMEYLGQIGASRNLLLRIDGDGAGQIQIRKHGERLDNKEYNKEQNLGEGATVGIYNID